MEIVPVTEPPMIVVRPATLFAFIKVFPFIICALGFLLLAWRYYPALALLSLVASFMGCYRFFYIRNCIYTLTPEVIKITRGLLFKRTDQVELFRVKDYVQTQPFITAIRFDGFNAAHHRSGQPGHLAAGHSFVGYCRYHPRTCFGNPPA
jgi:uncharacterized membrane protein YdbT with pleckstrin-like domain